MYILAIIDMIILSIVFVANLGLYNLNKNTTIAKNEFYQLQEYVINKYIEENKLDEIDTSKIYHIDYKTGDWLIFKEWTGWVLITNNWISIKNFNLWTSYSISFDITNTGINMKTHWINLSNINITK